MKKYKLKQWVKLALTTFMIGVLGSGIYVYMTKENNSNLINSNHIINAIIDDTLPINKSVEVIRKPFDSESVKISKNFYNKDDDSTTQEKSLIYYENIYIQNNGTLYSSDEQFDVISISNGTVKNIKEDNILGKIVEVEYQNGITVLYQSIDNIRVQENEVVKEGSILGTSGNNSLSEEKDNCLLIQIYKDGKLLDPEKVYGLEISNVE